jgi:HK97 gp10 family phage protein
MANQSVKEFRALLESLPTEIRTPLRQAVFAEALTLADKIRFAVPVKRGVLFSSIRVERSSFTALRALVRAGGSSTTVGDYDYALAQEFGTRHLTAQPFFWPTYRTHKRSIRKAIREAARTALSGKVKLV